MNEGIHWNPPFGLGPRGRFSRDWVSPYRDNQTEDEAPYSFSEYFLWRDEKVRPAGRNDFHAICDEGIQGAYSDRLSQWNHDKFQGAIAAVGGLSMVPSRETMSAFLTHYYGKPTVAHAMARGCNAGNGYPYWMIWFSHPTVEGD